MVGANMVSTPSDVGGLATQRCSNHDGAALCVHCPHWHCLGIYMQAPC